MTFWNPTYFDLMVAGTTTSIRSAPTVRCLNSRTWASGTSATSAWPRKSSYFNPLVFWHTKLFLARSLCVVLPWIVGANKANEYNKVVIKAQSSIFFPSKCTFTPSDSWPGKRPRLIRPHATRRFTADNFRCLSACQIVRRYIYCFKSKFN